MLITDAHGLDAHMAAGRFKHSEPPAPAPRGPIRRRRRRSSGWLASSKRSTAGAIYARRKAIVEPVFGQIDTVQDGRQLQLRGKPAARAQWRFQCTIHNLLKLHRAGGLDLISELNTAPAAQRRGFPAALAALTRTAAARFPRTLATHILWNASIPVTDPRS